jgi:hypothetical protein
LPRLMLRRNRNCQPPEMKSPARQRQICLVNSSRGTARVRDGTTGNVSVLYPNDRAQQMTEKLLVARRTRMKTRVNRSRTKRSSNRTFIALGHRQKFRSAKGVAGLPRIAEISAERLKRDGENRTERATLCALPIQSVTSCSGALPARFGFFSLEGTNRQPAARPAVSATLGSRDTMAATIAPSINSAS